MGQYFYHCSAPQWREELLFIVVVVVDLGSSYNNSSSFSRKSGEIGARRLTYCQCCCYWKATLALKIRTNSSKRNIIDDAFFFFSLSILLLLLLLLRARARKKGRS